MKSVLNADHQIKIYMWPYTDCPSGLKHDQLKHSIFCCQIPRYQARIQEFVVGGGWLTFPYRPHFQPSLSLPESSLPPLSPCPPLTFVQHPFPDLPSPALPSWLSGWVLANGPTLGIIVTTRITWRNKVKKCMHVIMLCRNCAPVHEDSPKIVIDAQWLM